MVATKYLTLSVAMAIALIETMVQSSPVFYAKRDDRIERQMEGFRICTFHFWRSLNGNYDKGESKRLGACLWSFGGNKELAPEYEGSFEKFAMASFQKCVVEGPRGHPDESKIEKYKKDCDLTEAESKPEKTKPEETKSEEQTNSEEKTYTLPSRTNPEDPESTDVTKLGDDPEAPAPADKTEPEDTKPEKTRPEDAKPEDTKPEETRREKENDILSVEINSAAAGPADLSEPVDTPDEDCGCSSQDSP